MPKKSDGGINSFKIEVCKQRKKQDKETEQEQKLRRVRNNKDTQMNGAAIPARAAITYTATTTGKGQR